MRGRGRSGNGLSWGQAGLMTGLVLAGFISQAASAASWPMRQRDMQHTGRADFSIPPDRLNGSLLSVFAWQKRSPGSPGEGNLSSTTMTFFDGAGPYGTDIVVGGYHWPKGVQGMDRHTGRRLWYGLPSGGESIGTLTPAFSPNGSTIYVVNDATGSSQYPNGFPLMAFASTSGPASFWHNGANPSPWHLSAGSPTIAPDGRVFVHAWVDRPYAGTDNGSTITETWAAATQADCGLAEPSLYMDGSTLKVVAAGRSGWIRCYHGQTGAELWSRNIARSMDAAVSIDPANGNIYVGCGGDSIWVAGLNKNGQPLWSSDAMLLLDHMADGIPHRAQGAGCLNHDGSTYYFQTNSQQADGLLFAINTANGSVRWTYGTRSAGWEMRSSSPIVTPNGVIIVGNNDGDTYYAIKDNGTSATLLDTLAVDAAGNARSSATLSPDGLLYLPLRTVWTAGNGDAEVPDNQVHNLFTAINLNSGATPKLWPPADQSGIPGNHQVVLTWTPVPDPSGVFDHYAVYRSTAPFTSVAGMTPITTLTGRTTATYTDATALNGTRYYYAVTSVTVGGGEVTEIQGIGPLTPWNETDLQVVAIARTPRYPRYWPEYTYSLVTEPSGFGPYWFSAATSLGGGQTPSTQRFPNLGDPVTYTATVRNRGSNPWSGTLDITWQNDGAPAAQESRAVSLNPGATADFSYVLNWDGALHDLTFTITNADARPGNNAFTIHTRSVAFLSYVDASYLSAFREETASYPQAATDDFIDWLNRCMVRFNQMFAEANSPKRVHFDILQVLPDSTPDPNVNTIEFAIFPFRYRAGEGTLRHSGYYDPSEDIDFGLLHEMGHQLGIIDLYQLDISAEANQVNGRSYFGAPACLMHGVSHFLSEHSALAMTHWQNVAHGYYGQYMYQLPQEVRLRVLDIDGQPLPGAQVQMFQICERPGLGKVITNQVKAQGTTDASGVFPLPNVPIDPGLVPPAYNGDTLQANPFGYVAVVGTNGVLLFKVQYQGRTDYAWLDITECNVAYWKGQTTVATLDRQLNLGGRVHYYPADDLTELNAADWSAYADGSNPQNTYVQDDPSYKQVGQASLKFVTDGGFDAWVKYPRSFIAQWDVSSATHLNMRVRAQNTNSPQFQNGSPWIRLYTSDTDYFQYQYYTGGNPVDLLNNALTTWRTYQVPLNAGGDVQNGWRRTSVGSPSLTTVSSIEIHADTWGGGFTLWLDGVGFSPSIHHPADLDHDGDVDSADAAAFRNCATGPSRGTVAPDCAVLNFDADADIDMDDFGVFQRCYTGPGLPVQPGCQN